jgi:Zn-dependent protease
MINTTVILQAAMWIIPLIIAIVFHEVAHGRVARYFGDQTAANAGRLSLNPLRHVDPIGTVALPLILAMTGAPMFGWAKGVPINPNQMRNPRWNMVAVALAGPMTNVALAIIAAVLFGVLGKMQATGTSGFMLGFVAGNLSNFIVINLFLAVFNMLPIPPFDGSKVLAGILPPRWGDAFRRLDRLGMVIAIVVLIVIPSLAPGFNPVSHLVGGPVMLVLQFLKQTLGLRI